MLVFSAKSDASRFGLLKAFLGMKSRSHAVVFACVCLIYRCFLWKSQIETFFLQIQESKIRIILKMKSLMTFGNLLSDLQQ